MGTLTYDDLVKREASFAELARAASREGRGPDFRNRLDHAARNAPEPLYITPRHQRGPQAQLSTALAAVRSHDIGELLRCGGSGGWLYFKGTKGSVHVYFGEGGRTGQATRTALAHYGALAPGFLAIRALDKDR